MGKYTIAEVSELIAGFAFKSKHFGDGYPDKVIKIADITPPMVDMNNLSSVDLSQYDKSKLDKYIAHKDDYVFAMTGATIGKIGRIESGKAYINQRVLLFKPRSSIDKDYLYYVLQQDAFRQYVLNYIDSNSAQPNISANTVGRFQFELPSMNIQKKVGCFLKNIDKMINNNKQINDNLEQQAFALFDSYFPSVSNGENTIGDYITPKRGKNLLSKDAVFGDVPVVAGGLEPSTYHNIANTNSPVLTISASGANSGFVRLWDIPVWSSDSSYIDIAMTPHVYFWFVMLKKRQKEIYDSQTGSAQPHIYPQHIAVMPVIDLNTDDIIDFTEQVTPLFQMIGANTEENSCLSNVRDTLLPRLLSGELDVSKLDF